MSFNIWDLTLPEYEKFTRKPRDPDCKSIDTQRIVAEILWGCEDARVESEDSAFSHLNPLAWAYAVVLKYKRERNGVTYPVISMSYDIDETWNIIIRQIQKSGTKKVSFRFNAGFDSVKYFIELVKENFTQKGIKVYMPIPEWIDGITYTSTAIQEMQNIQVKLDNLNATIDENSKEKTLESL